MAGINKHKLGLGRKRLSQLEEHASSELLVRVDAGDEAEEDGQEFDVRTLDQAPQSDAQIALMNLPLWTVADHVAGAPALKLGTTRAVRSIHPAAVIACAPRTADRQENGQVVSSFPAVAAFILMIEPPLGPQSRAGSGASCR
jgi:hypothetical protein